MDLEGEAGRDNWSGGAGNARTAGARAGVPSSSPSPCVSQCAILIPFDQPRSLSTAHRRAHLVPCSACWLRGRLPLGPP